MRHWRWWGRDANGRWRQGELEAHHRAEVLRILQTQGVVALEIRRVFHARRRIGPRALAWLVRQLATLLKAGVPLVQALDHLAREPANAAAFRLLSQLRQQIEAGQALSVALARHPQLFDVGFCQGVAAGELSGMLDLTLERLARAQEQRLRLRGRVRSALMYPLTILCMALGLVTCMMTMVVPSFQQTFAHVGSGLPLATRRVIACSEWLLAHGGECLLAVFCLSWVGVWLVRRRPGARLALERVLLRLPLLGPVLLQAALARWARTLGLLFAAGVPLCEALAPAGASSSSRVLHLATHRVEQRLRTGASLHDALSDGGPFPGLLRQMAAVGEESGALDQMLERVAEYYEEEVEQALLVLTSMLEPISLALLGALCGGLIWALYLPVFQLGQVVG